MIQYLLDTNAVIALLNNKSPVLSKRARLVNPSEIGISSVVAHELYYGAFKSQRSDQNVTFVDNIQFEIVAFNKEDAKQAGKIRAFLASQGKSIGSYDILIAGQAKARNLILITHNMKEFGRIKGLTIEDWEDG